MAALFTHSGLFVTAVNRISVGGADFAMVTLDDTTWGSNHTIVAPWASAVSLLGNTFTLTLSSP